MKKKEQDKRDGGGGDKENEGARSEGASGQLRESQAARQGRNSGCAEVAI